jgi:hypothetical protein
LKARQIAPTYSDNAKRIAALIAEEDGAGKAVAAVEQLIG